MNREKKIVKRLHGENVGQRGSCWWFEVEDNKCARLYTVDDKYLPVSHAHVQTSRDINKQLTGIYVLKQHGASSGRWSLSVSPQAAPSK